jgi:hypothetical protein
MVSVFSTAYDSFQRHLSIITHSARIFVALHFPSFSTESTLNGHGNFAKGEECEIVGAFNLATGAR